ncbi:hypothetical protein J5277_29150 [Rhizobium sp. 16-449-1b]|uniref:hypothetical protein n=1 Tax=Rhizobium sp. 16-449-1b TaxID=2819989 RepID=UPI001ADB5797|nr:hypothetical protein [Rhizobium sp. 16-449-1b]MBO9198201.1 hypothetical protein [Rhizobium sp. 16-449-1b]
MGQIDKKWTWLRQAVAITWREMGRLGAAHSIHGDIAIDRKDESAKGQDDARRSTIVRK